MIWLLTCEHYSNGIPLKYAELFIKAVDVLESPRGYDIRVAPMFIRLEPLFDQSFYYRYTRLLVEPNRSIHHRDLFSPFTTALSAEVKADLLSNYYLPYRNQVESFIRQYIDQQVIHISLHSFSSKSGNQDRTCPIGISFDSRNKAERGIAEVWKKCIRELDSKTAVRYNYPYRGNSDSFISYLRKIFPENYLGFELEIRNDKILDLRHEIYESIANLRGILD